MGWWVAVSGRIKHTHTHTGDKYKHKHFAGIAVKLRVILCVISGLMRRHWDGPTPTTPSALGKPIGKHFYTHTFLRLEH